MATQEINFSNAKRKLKELVPAGYNPRKLSKKAHSDLEASLVKFGLAEVPVLNADNTIMAGHQCVMILSSLYGLDHEIDVRIPNRQLTEEEEREYNIRSNKNQGEWDWDIMANNFDVKDLLDWGFQEFELSFYEQEEVKNDESDLTKSMDSYLDGNIRQIVLYFGQAEYEELIPKLDAIMAKEGLESYTDVFNKLLSTYEDTTS